MGVTPCVGEQVRNILPRSITGYYEQRTLPSLVDRLIPNNLKGKVESGEITVDASTDRTIQYIGNQAFANILKTEGPIPASQVAINLAGFLPHHTISSLLVGRESYLNKNLAEQIPFCGISPNFPHNGALEQGVLPDPQLAYDEHTTNLALLLEQLAAKVGKLKILNSSLGGTIMVDALRKLPRDSQVFAKLDTIVLLNAPLSREEILIPPGSLEEMEGKINHSFNDPNSPYPKAPSEQLRLFDWFYKFMRPKLGKEADTPIKLAEHTRVKYISTSIGINQDILYPQPGLDQVIAAVPGENFPSTVIFDYNEDGLPGGIFLRMFPLSEVEWIPVTASTYPEAPLTRGHYLAKSAVPTLKNAITQALVH